MPLWLIYSLLAMLFWGLWAFLPKQSMRTLDAPTALFFQQLGAMAMGLGVLAAARFRLKIEPTGISLALLTGFVGVCGLLCFFQAATRYRMSVVIMVTALYPIVTLALSVLILRERISGLQWLGILCAVIAIVLLSAPSE